MNRFRLKNNQTYTPVTASVVAVARAFCMRTQLTGVAINGLSVADGGRGSSG